MSGLINTGSPFYKLLTTSLKLGSQLTHNAHSYAYAASTPFRALANSPTFRRCVFKPLALIGLHQWISEQVDPKISDYAPAMHREFAISSVAIGAVQYLHQKILNTKVEQNWMARSLDILNDSIFLLSPVLSRALNTDTLDETSLMREPEGEYLFSCEKKAADYARSVAQLVNYSKAHELRLLYNVLEDLKLNSLSSMAALQTQLGPFIFASALDCEQMAWSYDFLEENPSLFSGNQTPRPSQKLIFQLALPNRDEYYSLNQKINLFYHKTFHNAAIVTHEIGHLEQFLHNLPSKLNTLRAAHITMISNRFLFLSNLQNQLKPAYLALQISPLAKSMMHLTSLCAFVYLWFSNNLLYKHFQRLKEYDADQHTLANPLLARGLINYLEEFKKRIQENSFAFSPFYNRASLLERIQHVFNNLAGRLMEPTMTHPLLQKRIDALQSRLQLS